MTAPSRHEIEPALVDELLALPTPERQAASLEAAGLLDPDGLGRLLDLAEWLMHGDPGKARRLAVLCAGVADPAGALAAVPRATYIRAGTHGIDSELDEELRLNRAARDGYLALGMNLEALRTNVGRMAALLELGRYEEALDAGRAVLDALSGAGEFVVIPTQAQADLLTALVHQNRGGCYEYMGRYDEALDAYAAAEELYRALNDTERLGEILSNRGAVLLHLGRGSEALAAHEGTVAIFKGAGLTFRHAQALSNLGEAHLHLANYMLSLDAFERARRLYASLDVPADEYLLVRDTANAYLQLNLYSEALAAYREAADSPQAVGMAHDRARTLWGMGSALIACREFEEAEKALAEAANLFDAAGNVPLLASVMLEQASLLAKRGDSDAALATANRVLELVRGDEWPVQLVYAHLQLSDLLLPDATEAERHLDAARRLAEGLALSQLRYRLNERLGRLRLLQGRDEEARALLESAVEEIERLRGTVAQEAMRASFLRDKTTAYEELLRLYLDRGDEGSLRLAFDVAEKAKSRALVDLLTGVAGKEGPDSAGDAELEERLRNLQADLNATYSRMLGGTDDEHGTPLPDLRERAVGLEREISRLRLRTVAMADPFTVSAALEEVLNPLPSDETLLSYHVVGDEIVTFVSVRDELKIVRNVGSASAVEDLLQQLEVEWDHFRAGAGFVGRHAALLERSARQVLAALYAELVEKLEGPLAETGASRKLVVVPHGPLHAVPFHALFDGERYLLERFEFSYAPSVRLYSFCRQRDPKGLDNALVVGVADGLIPAAAEEARAVARHLPGAEVLVDDGATVGALQGLADGRDVLHLACHGLFRSDNPMFSSLKLHDGWLTAADAMRLDLDGALVVLSACESGRNEVYAGDELIGLTRAFLGAGAATLAVSLWLVQDETTARFMERWYEGLRGGAARAQALRDAQLALKEEFPHPYYWAPFVLIGHP